MTAGAYGFPSLCLSIVYIRVTIFIHQQSNHQTLLIQRRQERDLIAIRRILITVIILISVGIPTVIVLIIANVTSIEKSIYYRIQCLSAAICLVELSITTVIFNPQLRNIIMKKWRRNRVEVIDNPVKNTIPMRNME